jgi:hypothetical protein
LPSVNVAVTLGATWSACTAAGAQSRATATANPIANRGLVIA